DSVRLRINLASALEMANDLDGAEATVLEALQKEPTSAVRLVLARILRRRERFETAKGELEKVLSTSRDAYERTEACFEMGLVLDRLDAPADAFAAFAEGNALRATAPDMARWKGERFLSHVQALTDWVSRENIEVAASGSPPEDRPSPVFFVGFPRSGTTLMEQALAAHPGLATTGEVSPLAPVLLRAQELLAAEGGYPNGLDSLQIRHINRLKTLFWTEAEKTVGGLKGRRLVDKLPLNIVDLALVNVLFPDARIVVALRDPRDCCLNCFMQRFAPNDAMVNFLDLEGTGRTYAAVMGLWLRYRDALTTPWHEYRYEDLVGDFDGTVRGVLDFIGVGWDDAVSTYRERTAGRTIATPSYRDVGAEIFDRAAGRWKRYEAQLSPIEADLAPLVEAFGYGK
ncbi:MAG: sulfotransferase, partial [Rhodospirillales bacterium]|nr:sulfotransferase [Rhodospirillales bacterium]